MQGKSCEPSRNDFIIVLILLAQLGFLFIYGFLGNYFPEVGNISIQVLGFQYILMAVLTFVGFGLMLNYFSRCTWTSMIATLYIVCLNLILTPLVHKFWYNCVISYFETDNVTTDTTLVDYQYRSYMERTRIQPSFFIMKIALGASISMIVFMHGVIGRFNLFVLSYVALVFNFGWSLSYNVIMRIATTLEWRTATNYNLLIFDQFGGNTIFLFGSMFGIGLALIMNCKYKVSKNSRRFHSDRHTILWAMIGSAVVFSLFAYLGQTNPKRLLNRGAVNVILAMTGSVIGANALSCAIRGYFGIRQSVYSIISGGIMIGVLGGLIDHIGVAISMGFLAGMLSTLWAVFILPWSNRRRILDSNGLTSLYFISSFLASIIVAPAIVAAYRTNFRTQTISNPIDNGATQISFVFDAYFEAVILIAYAVISGAIGFILGLLCGIFAMCSGTDDRILDDGIFLPKTYDFGPGVYHYMGSEQQSSIEDSISEIVQNHISGIKRLQETSSAGIKTNKKFKEDN